MHVLYEDLLRSSLRDPIAKIAVECVVPCLPSAAGLERMLKGCEVRQMPEHLVPQVAEPSLRGPKPSGMAMELAQRQRKSRAARRAQMEQEKQRQREAADEPVTGFVLRERRNSVTPMDGIHRRTGDVDVRPAPDVGCYRRVVFR